MGREVEQETTMENGKGGRTGNNWGKWEGRQNRKQLGKMGREVEQETTGENGKGGRTGL